MVHSEYLRICVSKRMYKHFHVIVCAPVLSYSILFTNAFKVVFTWAMTRAYKHTINVTLLLSAML